MSIAYLWILIIIYLYYVDLYKRIRKTRRKCKQVKKIKLCPLDKFNFLYLIVYSK